MKKMSTKKTFLLDKNSKTLSSNIILSFGIKGIAMLISVLSTPAYIKYFDNQKVLGLWFTLIAIFNWILNFDLGIGNGLRNKLAVALIENDKKKAKELVSSTYIIIGLLSLIIIIVIAVVVLSFNWNNFFNISTDEVNSRVLKVTMLIVLVGIIIQFWLKIITSILYAIEKTALPSLMMLLSSTMLLIYILFASIEGINSKLIFLAIAQVITVNLPLLFITIITFKFWLNDIKPQFKNYNKQYAKEVTTLGGNFFLIQIALMFISSTNEFMITMFYSAEYTVEYSIYFKWFNLALVLFSLITQPMWSAFTKAFAEKRYNWIKRIYKYFNICAIFSSIGCLCLVFCFQLIVNIWLGENAIQVNYLTALCFSGVAIFMMFINVSTSVANGSSNLKCQFIFSIIGAIVKVLGCAFLYKYFNNWSFIVFMNCFALFPLLIAQSVVTRKQLKYLF